VTLYVGVAGASQPEASLLDQAELVGRRLAEAGAVVVCGGGSGVMTAGGNPHLTVSLPTGLGQGRNLLLVRASDALVAIGGGFGTLSEIAHALRTGVPVVGLSTWSMTLAGRPVDAFPVAPDAEAAARVALEAARTRAARPDRPPPEL
jgi:predicted Rossmann-fold nucleotide-binding protein